MKERQRGRERMALEYSLREISRKKRIHRKRDGVFDKALFACLLKEDDERVKEKSRGGSGCCSRSNVSSSIVGAVTAAVVVAAV